MKTTDYLTLSEAGERLGLDPETVRRYIARGILRGANLGVRVLAEDVERYERERQPAHRPVDLSRDKMLEALCRELKLRGVKYRSSAVQRFLTAYQPAKQQTVKQLADEWESMTASH